ncbi:MAG: 1,6-anhydro-N-acetylmuramyl-L-alanine amidase AmpD [Gammaproteobacteria bacterium]|nr:1,6-anhydro-N-acetylmuramyl-L-alanine amidase AmpD [Gammaproteobacteria bacterium]
MEIYNHIIKNIPFLNSPNFNDRPDEKKIFLIVIHSISLPPKSYGNTYVEDFFLNKLNIQDNEYFIKIKDLKVSSHLYVKRDGKIIQFVPFNKRAWHAGDSRYKGEKDCNNFSIGIELEGNDKDIYTDQQYKSLVAATKLILKKYPLIKKENIVGHSDISPGRKKDPGEKFNWSKYIKQL